MWAERETEGSCQDIEKKEIGREQGKDKVKKVRKENLEDPNKIEDLKMLNDTIVSRL